MQQKHSARYAVILLIIIAGAIFRIWNLDSKPVWPDELYTIVYSLGFQFQDLPTDRLLTTEQTEQILKIDKSAGLVKVWTNESSEDTHPPLFFCLSNAWLKITGFSIWNIRILSVLFGILTIWSAYALTRLYSKQESAWLAAIFMAFSPFAISLSQEARHYTMAMFLVTVAIAVGYRLLFSIIKGVRVSVYIFAAWVLVNVAGLYTHYFFIFAVCSQIAAMVIVSAFHKHRHIKNLMGYVFFGILLVTAGFYVQAATMLTQVSSPATEWLSFNPTDIVEYLHPVFYSLFGFVTTAFGMTVIDDSWVATSALTSFFSVIAVWLIWQMYRGAKQLAGDELSIGFLFVTAYMASVLFAFVAASYVFERNIPYIMRYNFIYFPALISLMGVTLNAIAVNPSITRNRMIRLLEPSRKAALWIVATIFVLFSGLVISDITEYKWLVEDEAFDILESENQYPVVVVAGAAVGLSYAATLANRKRQKNREVYYYLAEERFMQSSVVSIAAELDGAFDLLLDNRQLSALENSCTEIFEKENMISKTSLVLYHCVAW